MKTLLLPLIISLAFVSACASDGADGNDANDTTENALQLVGDHLEENVKEAVDSGVPKLGRAVDKVDEKLEKAGDKIDRAGDRIEQRFNEGRDRDTVR